MDLNPHFIIRDITLNCYVKEMTRGSLSVYPSRTNNLIALKQDQEN